MAPQGMADHSVAGRVKMEGERKILVIEDDPAVSRLISMLLERSGLEGVNVFSAKEAFELVHRRRPELILLDLGLPDVHGFDVLARLKKTVPEIPVIVLTGDHEVSNAVKAMQLGAYNYFTKPFNSDQFVKCVRNALDNMALQRELQDLKQQLAESGSIAKKMGPSDAIRRLWDQVRQVAPTSFTVLIDGETGSGKELVARAIHDNSARSAKPFIALDCGAIPETLLESELFGFERGAFSGADHAHAGYFQQAEGGTLFLDEVSNLTPALQAKLLRVLQERKLRPLGGQRDVLLDLRIVAAANLDLERAATEGHFRQDLFFRLAEIRVSVPALRDRPEDIPFLAQRFLDEASAELNRPVVSITAEALQDLQRNNWPGNVRELKNFLRQAVLGCNGLVIREADLKNLGKQVAVSPVDAVELGYSLKEISNNARFSAERAAICRSLIATQGNILRAAQAMKIDNKTLHFKLKKYKIQAKDFAVRKIQEIT